MHTVQRDDQSGLAAAAVALRAAGKVVALTGAGISVASGIPDFRSPGGLWTVFSPEEYATIEVFERNPAKAWELFRALGKVLAGKEPNAAHHALAELESMGLLAGIVTQNIDNLHQQAGSRRVFEIHGDHHHLQCLRCDSRMPVTADLYRATTIPLCEHCGAPLKPNVVLFGEAVRDLEAIHAFVADCDLLLVIGTSAQVYPAAGLPSLVWQNGGRIIECNRESVLRLSGHADVFLAGAVEETLPQLVAACRRGSDQ